MRDIYSRASRVIIWLGDPDYETGVVLSFLQRLAEAGRDIYKLSPQQQERASAQAGIPAARNEWRAFGRLLERPWFTRTWIWQEVALAKDLFSGAEVRIGHYYFNWLLLAAVTNYIPLCGWDTFMGSTLWTRINTIEEARSGQEIRKTTMTLLKAFSYTRDCGVTDPRDKVFALYGLIEDGSDEGIEIDYAKTVKAVFTDVTRYLVLGKRDLGILSMVQSVEPAHNLPSWVPDWSRKFTIDLLAVVDEEVVQKRRYHTSSDTKAAVRVDEDNASILIVGAITLGAISGLGQPQLVPTATSSNPEMRDETTATGITTEIIRNEWLAMLLSLGDQAYPGSGETYLRAFARTILADRDRSQIRATPKLYSALDQWLSFNEPNDQLNGDLRRSAPREVVEYELAVLYSAGQKRFFVDGGGWIGLAPSAAREGDKICLFFGAQVPFLVRKTEDGLYQFVGECYVHGIIDGEVMRAATDNEEMGP